MGILQLRRAPRLYATRLVGIPLFAEGYLTHRMRRPAGIPISCRRPIRKIQRLLGTLLLAEGYPIHRILRQLGIISLAVGANPRDAP